MSAETDYVELNYGWFKTNLPDLVKRYEDKYVVIKDCAILASYGSHEEAFRTTLKTEKAGTFLIQLCSLDKAKTTQTFHSRVRFEA